MKKNLKQWLVDNRYELYAEAKGYYVYENDEFTIIIKKGKIILKKPL